MNRFRFASMPVYPTLANAAIRFEIFSLPACRTWLLLIGCCRSQIVGRDFYLCNHKILNIMKKLLSIVSFLFCIFCVISCTNTQPSNQSEEIQVVETPPIYELTLDTETPIVGTGVDYFQIIDENIVLTKFNDTINDFYVTKLTVEILKKDDVRHFEEFKIIILDENKEEMFGFETTLNLEQDSEWDLESKLNYGDGFVDCKFQNYIDSDFCKNEDEIKASIKAFHDNMPKAKYFRVLIQLQ